MGSFFGAFWSVLGGIEANPGEPLPPATGASPSTWIGPGPVQATRGSPQTLPKRSKTLQKNDPPVVPHVDRQEGGGIKKALFGKVVSAAESDPQTTLACSTGLFGFLRSSNGAQTISGEAALEWKNVRKWVVQDIFEAVGPPWFSAGLTGFARANAGCEQKR